MIKLRIRFYQYDNLSGDSFTVDYPFRKRISVKDFRLTPKKNSLLMTIPPEYMEGSFYASEWNDFVKLEKDTFNLSANSFLKIQRGDKHVIISLLAEPVIQKRALDKRFLLPWNLTHGSGLLKPRGIGISLVALCTLFAVLYGQQELEITRYSMSELQKRHVIHRDYFETGPELMRQAYDRKDPGRGLIHWIEQFSSLMGAHVEDEYPLFFQNDREQAERLRSKIDQVQDTLENETKQKRSLKITYVDNWRDSLYLGTAERIKQSKEILVFSKERLESRRAYTKEHKFNSEYNYQVFKGNSNVSANIRREKARSDLGAVTPFSALSDEETMYFEAERISKKASSYIMEDDPIFEIVWFNEDDSKWIHHAFEAVDVDQVRPYEPQEKKVNILVYKQKIQNFIRTKEQQIAFCYEKSLNQKPFLAGKTVWKWTVTAQGRVEGLNLKQDTVGDKSLANCVKSSIQSWLFPNLPVAIQIEYPFEFETRTQSVRLGESASNNNL